jgi:hypothetical protein
MRDELKLLIELRQFLRENYVRAVDPREKLEIAETLDLIEPRIDTLTLKLLEAA